MKYLRGPQGLRRVALACLLACQPLAQAAVPAGAAAEILNLQGTGDQKPAAAAAQFAGREAG